MSTPSTLAVLWRTFRHYRWQIVTLILLGILSATLDGIGINALIPLISFFTGATNGPTDLISGAIQSLFSFFHVPFIFRYLLAFILGLFFLRAIVMTFSGYIRGWISADFLGKESEAMLRKLLGASWPFLLKQRLGTLQATLIRDVQRSESLLGVFAQLIQSFTGFLIYLLVALNISPIMTVWTLAAGAVLLLIVRPFLSRSQATAGLLVAGEKTYTHFLSEHIIGIKSIKAAGAEEPALNQGGMLVGTLRKLSVRMALIRSMSNSLFQPFSLIFVIILFSITYRSPDFNMVAFAAALYLIQKIFTYLESAQSALHSIRETVPYVHNIVEFKKKLDEHKEDAGVRDLPFEFERELEFKNVSFAYGKTENVVSGISFCVQKGKTLGLIGPSGAGKTSVTDLLLRLFHPKEGEITLDGISAEKISLEQWRRHIGYVAQDVFLFNGSIEDNIRFYRSELSAQEIQEAAKQANIHDFINTLPEGYGTQTGDRGVMLSGGQRQRIALARALAGRPSILVLDEATSALDHESEKLIHESIRALHGKMTVVIVAHRPSTVAEADTIAVLNQGCIVEQGTPQELMRNPHSYFYKMQNA